MLEGSTAPHCKQVLVTGEFCAADAHTPARVYEKRIARLPRWKTTFSGQMLRKSYRWEVSFEKSGATSGVNLLGQHVATESDPPFEGYRGEVRTLGAFHVRPGAPGRLEPREGGADEIEHAVIGAHRL